MPLIGQKDREALTRIAEDIENDVELTLYTQRKSALIVPGVVTCETCEHTEQLVGEIGEIMPKVRTNVVDLVESRDQAIKDEVDRVPTILLGGGAQRRVRFVGFPGGYEAASFIKSIMEAGGAGGGIAQDLQTKLGGVRNPVDIKVFVTPT